MLEGVESQAGGYFHEADIARYEHVDARPSSVRRAFASTVSAGCRMTIAILPTRTGSQRVPGKNTREFAGIPGGLTRIKIAQLVACPAIDRVILTTDDLETKRSAHSWAHPRPDILTIHERPPALASSSTLTDDLIRHVAELLDGASPSDPVIWTHVTSPFFQSADYAKALEAFRRVSKEGHHDSLMTGRRLQEFIWNARGPVNYDPVFGTWPNTQTLEPLWLIDNAAFIAPVSTYLTGRNRIGKAPYFMDVEWPQSIDVDWPQDFAIAEFLWLKGVGAEQRPASLPVGAGQVEMLHNLPKE